MRVVSLLPLFVALAGCQIDASATLDDEDPDLDEDNDEDEDEEDDGPVEVTVVNIQKGLIAEGTWVELDGLVVTAVAPTGVFVQQAEGGAFSGVFVYLGHPDSLHDRWTDIYAAGDVVRVSGVVSEYAEAMDQFAVPTVTEIVASNGDLTVTGSTSVPAPVVIDPKDLFDPERAERWEGVLVSVQSPFVLDANIGYGEFLIEPGVPVDDWMFGVGKLYAGDRWDAIVGVVHFTYGEYKLEPRGPADFIGYDSGVTRLADVIPGDLIVTEVMLDPTACDDADAEYVEIANLSGGTIDVDGLVLQVGDGTFTFSGERLVGDGGILLGHRATSDRCYGVVPHFDYDMGLDEGTGERITLMTPSTVVDVVDLRGWTVPTGASLSLDARVWHHEANDAAEVWCAAGSADGELFGPSGPLFDYGSPGYPNVTPCW